MRLHLRSDAELLKEGVRAGSNEVRVAITYWISITDIEIYYVQSTPYES